MKNIYFKSSDNMSEIKSNSVDLIITSPPYFNIKDYSLDGKQLNKHSKKLKSDVSNTKKYEKYLENMLNVWKECNRILKPNGKLCINVPLLPMIKKNFNSHYNRHIFDLNSDIQHSILKSIPSLFLMDVYIWNRTNSTKKLMFGSYPYPGNFYAQNTTEFISVYVKDGKPKIKREYREQSKLSKDEWIEYTNQIWNIPVPNRGDLAFGKHTAIMPEEIPRRLIKLFSNVDDIILDPFTGSGTTGKVALSLGRKFFGYEVYDNYENLINEKLELGKQEWKKKNLIK